MIQGKEQPGWNYLEARIKASQSGNDKETNAMQYSILLLLWQYKKRSVNFSQTQWQLIPGVAMIG